MNIEEIKEKANQIFLLRNNVDSERFNNEPVYNRVVSGYRKQFIDAYVEGWDCQQSKIEELEADKLEMAKAIVEDPYQYNGESYVCWRCGNFENEQHSVDCIVNKANKYMEGIK